MSNFLDEFPEREQQSLLSKKHKFIWIVGKIFREYWKTSDVVRLEKDLRNVIFHLFDHHQLCRKAVCKKSPVPVNDAQLTKLSPLTHDLVRSAEKLALNLNTNRCEGFVAMYVMFCNGRRSNFSRREDAIRRATLAGLNICSGEQI
jgi:hypothetical protein